MSQNLLWNSKILQKLRNLGKVIPCPVLVESINKRNEANKEECSQSED